MHNQDDKFADTFSFLGNSKSGLESDDGMIVFGFGRGSKGIEPLMTGVNSFRIGFIEQSGETPEDYDSIKQKLVPDNN